MKPHATRSTAGLIEAPDATNAPQEAPSAFDPLAATRAIRDADGQKTDKAVLLMLVSRCNRLGVCHPTVARLARDVGTSVRDIYRALERLRFAKMVGITSAPRKASIYRLRVEDLNSRKKWELLKLAADCQRHGEKLWPDAPPSNDLDGVDEDTHEPPPDPIPF